MSHRLEENEDTKYEDYKEPRTPRTYSTIKPDAEDKQDSTSHRHTGGDVQTQNTQSIWDLARKSDSNASSPGERRSSVDMDQSVDNVINGIEKGANKAKLPSSSALDDNNNSRADS